MALTSVDDKILGIPSPESAPIQETPQQESYAQDDAPATTHIEPEVSSLDADSNTQSDVEHDDYGTPVQKKPEKMYTQSEVQEMMRERLSRGQFAQQQDSPAPVQQQQQQYQDPNMPLEDWQKELEEFTEKVLEKREQKLHQQQWQQQERNIQAQFEAKFNQGMAKYPDFETVIVGKGITPDMVIATRGMNDPAAFLYAAAKSQPKELERIASIPDKLAQAVEIGKLEERMRKARRTTGAPAPVAPTAGDMPERRSSRAIDDKIIEDAKKKHQRY
ncbi:MAG: hypothetical protein KBC53_02750 [Nitrosomonas sp.]|nr:hypothetical protein [Nitrosomonas sp.]